MERDFIRPIDAHDNGVDRWPLAPMFRMYNRPGAKDAIVLEQFQQALGAAQALVANQLHQVKVDLEAEDYLQQCWKQAQDAGENIVVINRQLGNRTAPTLLGRLSNWQAELMVYPQSMSRKNNKWFIRAIHDGEGSQGYHTLFPEHMRGKSNATLDLGDGTTAQFSFVHNSGFLAQIEGQFADTWRVAMAISGEQKHQPTENIENDDSSLRRTIKP